MDDVGKVEATDRKWWVARAIMLPAHGVTALQDKTRDFCVFGGRHPRINSDKGGFYRRCNMKEMRH